MLAVVLSAAAPVSLEQYDADKRSRARTASANTPRELNGGVVSANATPTVVRRGRRRGGARRRAPAGRAPGSLANQRTNTTPKLTMLLESVGVALQYAVPPTDSPSIIPQLLPWPPMPMRESGLLQSFS